MADQTKIQWADHTFNPWWGCARVSPACRFCYAETMARRFAPGTWGAMAPRKMSLDDYWEKPLQWNAQAERSRASGRKKTKRRRRVFCASMADVFEILPNAHPQRLELDRARQRLYALIERTPHLDWMLLTKRPQNIVRCKVPHLRNIWLGTTVENCDAVDERVPLLVAAEGPFVRFVSAEPLLERIEHRLADYVDKLDWVIAGGESGAHARPMHPSWPRALRTLCAERGVSFFFKQWGEWIGVDDLPKAAKGERFKLTDVEHLSRERRHSIDLEQDTIGQHTVPFAKVVRLGNKRTGHLLDGQEYRAFPKQMRLC